MNSLPLIRFFHDVYRIYHPRLRSKNSVVQYESVCRILDRYHQSRGHTPATTQDFSPELILGAAAQLINDDTAPRTPATANRIIRTAAALWKEAARRKYAPPVPDEPLPQYDEPKKHPRCWSPEEFDAMLRATESEFGYIGPVPASSWFLGLQLFVFWTGARITAVMAAKTIDFDPDACTVKIGAESQKHKSDGLYDLPADVCGLLVSWGIQSRGLDTIFGDWTFDRNQPGWRALNRRLSRILERAELPATRKDKWHKIRKTHATRVAAKRGIAVAQQMLGHSSPRVTEAYIDPRFIERPKATEILDAPKVPVASRFRIVG